MGWNGLMFALMVLLAHPVHKQAGLLHATAGFALKCLKKVRRRDFEPHVLKNSQGQPVVAAHSLCKQSWCPTS